MARLIEPSTLIFSLVPKYPVSPSSVPLLKYGSTLTDSLSLSQQIFYLQPFALSKGVSSGTVFYSTSILSESPDCIEPARKPND